MKAGRKRHYGKFAQSKPFFADTRSSLAPCPTRFDCHSQAVTTPELFDADSLDQLHAALEELKKGFARLPPAPLQAGCAPEQGEILLEVARRLQNEFPFFHPLYAGQMLKPPHPLARLAYALSMWINPNNHALDGGRASSQMEKEAVAELARMFGWTTHLGHLTSGGTMANLEALWIAGPAPALRGDRRLRSGPLYSCQDQSGARAQYEPVATRPGGPMDAEALERRLAQGGVGTVVATIGTTSRGAVDPLPEILALRESYGFRLHVDGAYGGYFALVDNLRPETRRLRTPA